MKTINIPTTIKEIWLYLKTRCSRRRNHNIEVLREFAMNVIIEIERNYWINDISNVMKERITNRTSGKIIELYKASISKLK